MRAFWVICPGKLFCQYNPFVFLAAVSWWCIAVQLSKIATNRLCIFCYLPWNKYEIQMKWGVSFIILVMITFAVYTIRLIQTTSYECLYGHVYIISIPPSTTTFLHFPFQFAIQHTPKNVLFFVESKFFENGYEVLCHIVSSLALRRP